MNTQVSSPLKTEHHIHLYGCLSSDDLWEIGKDSHKNCADRLDWYAAEYEKAWGRKPNWQSYWQGDDGLALLKKDFLFLQREPFPKFQACFNLIIALCKVNPESPDIVRRVFYKLRASGLIYAEARTVLPPYLKGAEMDTYLRTIAEEVLRIEAESAGAFLPRLAISLPREAPFTMTAYATLRSWMDTNPKLAKAFSAVDLAFYEENDPPKQKAIFVKEVLNDNRTANHKLAVLYHVGESFNTLSAASSARWVWEAAQLGATRLGHAISLGINPAELIRRPGQESVAERIDHINWLLKNREWLRDHSYEVNQNDLTNELKKLEQEPANAIIKFQYDETYGKDLYALQDAIMNSIKSTTNTVIECCPTSNIRIGMITNLKNHPLRRFAKQGLRTCISTDDPGIFEISLASEYEVAARAIELSPKSLGRIADEQMQFCSDKLLFSRI